MKQIIRCDELFINSNFIPWFLMTNFPEGIDTYKDISLSEIIQEKYDIDRKWIDNLTGYYDGIFEENDGYIDTPKAVLISLSNGDKFCVEFHPGDTIYYINENEIGCTGPSYFIRKISLEQYFEYTSNMNTSEKIFLLPMLKIVPDEKDVLANEIKSVLSTFNLQKDCLDDVSVCILENCLE